MQNARLCLYLHVALCVYDRYTKAYVIHMHEHTDSSPLPVLWLPPPPPLLAAALSMGAREGGCGAREPPSVLHPGGSGGAHPGHPGACWPPRGWAALSTSPSATPGEKTQVGKIKSAGALGNKQALRWGWPPARP